MNIKSRLPHRWNVQRFDGDIVRDTVYVTKRAAIRVAKRAREAGLRAVVRYDGVAIA